MTRALAHFELFLYGFVLVAVGTVKFLSFDLILFLEMGLMDKGDLFGKFYLLGLESIPWLAVTVGGHTAGIQNVRPCLDGLAAHLDIGEAFGWALWDVAGRLHQACRHGLAQPLRFIGWIVALHATHILVLAFLPKVIPFLYHFRVGENMAAPAKKTVAEG